MKNDCAIPAPPKAAAPNWRFSVCWSTDPRLEMTEKKAGGLDAIVKSKKKKKVKKARN